VKITDPPIVVEHLFQASKEKLWNALTKRDQMVQWFFDNIEAFEPVVGFQTHFTVENEGRVFPHLWKITEVKPLQKITYNWKYEGYPGDSYLTFELTEQGSDTRLTVTHRVIESFPQNIPEFKRESCLGGWHYFIKQRLHDYINTTQ